MKKVVSAVAVTIIYWAMAPTVVQAQGDPIKWQFTAIPLSDQETRLIFTASLEDGWHNLFSNAGGRWSLPTTFTFTPDRSYSLKGSVKEESTPVEEFDGVFMMNIVWFKDTSVLRRK